MRARGPLAACAVALLACPGAPAPEAPAPLSIAPAQGTALAPLAVEIAGRGFAAEVRTDLAARSGSVDAGFTAELAPAAGGAPIALLDVVLTPGRTLRATVPAGIPHGAYDLSVADAAGRRGVLRQAFRVVTSAEHVAAFRVDAAGTPRAGVPFAVSLAAVDAQGLTVDGFDGSVGVSDASGTAAPATLGPFLLGRLQAQVTVSALFAGDRLTVADALGHSGVSEPFDVVAGPAVALAFVELPAAATAAACSPAVTLELRDALGHPASVDAEVTAALQSAPPGAAFFSDDGCAAPISSLAFPAGASRATFRFRADAAGTLTLRAVPSTLPSAAASLTIAP